MGIILSSRTKQLQGKKVAHLTRLTTIIGNWKMNKTLSEARSFVSGLALSSFPCRVGLAVPYTMISVASEAARGTAMMIGAQSVSAYEDGPFTGEVSCKMIKDAGASFAIVGHSERRTLFHEDNEIVNKKVHRLIAEGIQPLICIGETLEQRQKNKTEEVLSTQLLQSLKGLSSEQFADLMMMIAYEPVWAIGTGIAASIDNVQSAFAFIRKTIAGKWGIKSADQVTLLYGGSVQPENSAEFLSIDDVDGLLVGGASLSLEVFSKVLQARDVLNN